MAKRTTVIVDLPAIHSMFVPTGEIGRWGGKLNQDVLDAVRRRTPTRSRRLWREMKASRYTLPLGILMNVKAFAPYAMAVEKGTLGALIIPRNPAPMALYSSRGGERFVPAEYASYRHHLTWSVQGQKGKHFMRKGLKAGMLRNKLR